MSETTESPQAKAIKDALVAFMDQQIDIYKTKPFKISRFGINRTTWQRLDQAARAWRREIRPDPYVMDFTGLSIADMAWISLEGKHRVTKLRNAITGDWAELEEDIHLPDGMIELIYELGPAYRYKTAGHMVDITALLEAGQ